MTEGAGKQNSQNKITRPPIVVVMGHIDHGKSTLLDHVRKTKTVEKETGGITQHIGAYEAEHQGKRITFIDTPGHEAFSQMRSRGAKVADIAVLVVSAEEGVKQQTKEAIAIIKEAGIPFVVAINKIDKPNSDIPRTKKELADNDILIEDYGGKIPAVEISAKVGTNVDQLLDTILLVAELEELAWNPAGAVQGLVIESHIDPRRGKAATLLIREGKLHRGDFLVIQSAVTPLRVIENFLGRPFEEASASMPVLVFGLSELPLPGVEFHAFSTKAEAKKFAERPLDMKAAVRLVEETEKPFLNIILKTDVSGSEEAIRQILLRLQFQKVGSRIIKSETGDISESDIKMAESGKDSVIVGFRVKVPSFLQELANQHGIRIITRDIIYELEDEIKKEMIKLVPPEVHRVDLGTAKILATFSREKTKQIIGGHVTGGIIRKGARFDVERNGVKIGEGRTLNLQREKQNTSEIKEGLEFGMLAEAEFGIVKGDILRVYEEERIAPALE